MRREQSAFQKKCPKSGRLQNKSCLEADVLSKRMVSEQNACRKRGFKSRRLGNKSCHGAAVLLNDRSMERCAYPRGGGGGGKEEKAECMEVRPGEMVMDS